MKVEDNFRHWLECDYKNSKYNKPLKRSSAAAYVSGIKSLSVKLGMERNAIYEIDDLDKLDILQKRIHNLPSASKDEKSHFSAYFKFISDTYLLW